MIEPVDCLALKFDLFYRFKQAHIADHGRSELRVVPREIRRLKHIAAVIGEAENSFIGEARKSWIANY